MTHFAFQCRTKTSFGKQALAHLPFDLAAMGGSKPMVIQDNAVSPTGHAKCLAKAFYDSSMVLGISPPLPAIHGEKAVNFIKSMYELYKEKGYDCLIALGGEDVANVTKALNIAVTLGPETLTAGEISNALTPLVYIPTGVETGTASAGLYHFNNKTVYSPYLAPDQALLDPALFISDPRDTLLDSALATLAIACETFALCANPPARAYATTIIRLAVEVLNAFKSSGLSPEDNLAQRKKEEKQWQTQLIQAAVFAGYLITGQSAAPDRPAIGTQGRAIADKSRLTPGLAMMLLLPDRLTAAPKTDTAALLQPLAGPATFSAVPGDQRPAAAVQEIRDLVNGLHLMSRGRLPRTLTEAGWKQAAVDALECELKGKEQ